MEWTGAIFSLLFLVSVYLLSGKATSPISVDDTSAYRVSGTRNEVSVSGIEVSPTKIYADDTVRVLLYKASDITDIMHLHENSPVPRSYSQTDSGVAVVE